MEKQAGNQDGTGSTINHTHTHKEGSTMNYYVAINNYRTSTSNGFSNTWWVYRCKSRRHQRGVLTVGLPVSDQYYIDTDGRAHPVVSTMGIRIATRVERRRAERNPETADLLAPQVD